MGSYIYYVNNILNKRTSNKEFEIQTAEWEKKYKKYETYKQPRIVAVNVDVDLFPKTRDIKASGEYIMINKSTVLIDSIFLDHNSAPSTFKFDKENSLVSEDTLYNFDIYKLNKPLLPGDSLKLNFTVKNKPNTLLRNNSRVISNGTFINPNTTIIEGSRKFESYKTNFAGYISNEIKLFGVLRTIMGLRTELFDMYYTGKNTAGTETFNSENVISKIDLSTKES